MPAKPLGVVFRFIRLQIALVINYNTIGVKIGKNVVFRRFGDNIFRVIKVNKRPVFGAFSLF